MDYSRKEQIEQYAKYIYGESKYLPEGGRALYIEVQKRLFRDLFGYKWSEYFYELLDEEGKFNGEL